MAIRTRGGAGRASRIAIATVRQAAVHSAGLWRDAGARAPLGRPSVRQRRARAQRRGSPRTPWRCGGRSGRGGRGRSSRAEHSATYALIEIGNPSATPRRAARARPHRTAAPR